MDDSARSLNARHRATYDRIAPAYAASQREMRVNVEASAERFLAQVGVPARVLDLGCGHGRDMAWFESRGVTVVGADLSGGMLAEAKRRVKGSLVQLDMRFPAFRNAGFDAAWCDAAIMHLPKGDLPAALREIHRILVPNGVLFVSMQVGKGEDWESWSYNHPAPRFFARYQPEEFGKLLVAAGFAIRMQADMPVSPSRHWAHYLAQRDAVAVESPLTAQTKAEDTR